MRRDRPWRRTLRPRRLDGVRPAAGRRDAHRVQCVRRPVLRRFDHLQHPRQQKSQTGVLTHAEHQNVYLLAPPERSAYALNTWRPLFTPLVILSPSAGPVFLLPEAPVQNQRPMQNQYLKRRVGGFDAPTFTAALGRRVREDMPAITASEAPNAPRMQKPSPRYLQRLRGGGGSAAS